MKVKPGMHFAVTETGSVKNYTEATTCQLHNCRMFYMETFDVYLMIMHIYLIFCNSLRFLLIIPTL